MANKSVLRPLHPEDWHSMCSVPGCGLGAIVIKAEYEFELNHGFTFDNDGSPLCTVHAKRELDYLEDEYQRS